MRASRGRGVVADRRRACRLRRRAGRRHRRRAARRSTRSRAQLVATRASTRSTRRVRSARGSRPACPRQGFDIDETTIPQEAFLERDAVSFTKGCFLGQELVCRIDTRGHVNRYLRRVHGESDALAAGRRRIGDRRPRRRRTHQCAPGSEALAMVRREIEPPARGPGALERRRSRAHASRRCDRRLARASRP